MAARHRRVSRIIVLDRDDNVLLFLTQSPKVRNRPERWITPGGGVEGHETHLQGALRELYEETGIHGEELVGPVHTVHTESVLKSGDIQTSYAEFFILQTDRFDVNRANWLDYEHDDILDVRWFTHEEIATHSTEVAPAELLDVIKAFLGR